MTKQRTGIVRDIATVEQEADTRAWNTIMLEDGARVTFAARDKDHAKELADLINVCCWVKIYNARSDER